MIDVSAQQKPVNDERMMQSASFSLRPWHVEAVRQAALRQRVSQSEIVRQVLDSALRQTEDQAKSRGAAMPPAGNSSYLIQAMRPLARELAIIRRELDDVRQVVARLEASGIIGAHEAAPYLADQARHDE